MIALSSWLPRMRLLLPVWLGSSPVLVRAISWLLATLVVGWVASGLFWQIFAPESAPRPEAASMPDLQSAARAVASRHLFGRTSSPGDELGGEPGRVNLKLLGAMTSTPESVGFAIIAEEGKPSVAAVEGETFMPGVTLVQILPGKVRVKIGEREELIEMTKQASASEVVPAGDPAAAQAVHDDQGGPARRSAFPRPERPRP